MGMPEYSSSFVCYGANKSDRLEEPIELKINVEILFTLTVPTTPQTAAAARATGHRPGLYPGMASRCAHTPASLLRC